MDPVRHDSQASHLRIHAVNIFVRDQEVSLRFFRDQLGFDVAFDGRLQSGQRWVAVAPPDGSTVLRLIAPNPDTEAYNLIGQHTQVVFLTNDVMARFREWSKRGVRFRNTPRLKRVHYAAAASGWRPTASASHADHASAWGGVFARFLDPDGNLFGLVEFDDATRELEEQRREVERKREAERRAAQELEIARQVQARLFPQNLPALNTLDYAGVCIQARQVGGDYYDFLNLGQERLGLVIGDIAGKGIAAALLMANLQANLRSQCAVALSHPQCFLESVNRLFFENTTESAYATLFFGEYDDTARRLRYVNCGHLSPLLLRGNNTIERLESTSTVVGLFRQWSCSVRECQMDPGDTMALYTDGVTEAFDENGEEFGEDRLAELLQRNRSLPTRELVTSVVEAVKTFSPHEQHDDITLIVAKCGGQETSANLRQR